MLKQKLRQSRKLLIFSEMCGSYNELSVSIQPNCRASAYKLLSFVSSHETSGHSAGARNPVLLGKEATIMRLKSLVLLGIVAIAPSAYAQNTPKTATGTNTVSATLAVKATLAKAVQLTLNTGSGCTVSNGGGGDFSLDFGTVDALGISTGCAGAGAGKYTSTAGGSQAIFYSDYSITPAFTNQGTISGSTLSAYVSSAFGQSGFSIVQTNTAPSAFADFTAMSTASGAQTDVKGASSIASNTALTRYIGVKVDGTNSNTPTGSSSTAVVTYTLTIQ
jgi:hypothetical protein